MFLPFWRIMKYTSFFKILVWLGLLLMFSSSCSGEDPMSEVVENEIVPINLTWSITILGADENNLNGDGSGIVLFKVSAINAVRYSFKFGNNKVLESTNGEQEFTFTEVGINDYDINILAYSSTDNVISISKTVSVLVSGSVQENKVALIWSDEFNNDGSVSSSNWFSEIVPPVNGGWFNAEQQHYTDRTDNAYISNGTLKIIAKKEVYTAFNSTKNYTSARLNSEFTFTYGRIEVRAKLPEGGGTWPAIWTLGTKLNTIGWPSCGEIDIMEHVGNNIGGISSAIHTPSSHGNTVNVGRIDIPDATTEFHVYKVDWTAEKMDFYVDDTLYYSYNPELKNSSTWPFDSDQFILLNIAMGGTLGGAIATDFNQAILEIDYVRVYQD